MKEKKIQKYRAELYKKNASKDLKKSSNRSLQDFANSRK